MHLISYNKNVRDTTIFMMNRIALKESILETDFRNGGIIFKHLKV